MSKSSQPLWWEVRRAQNRKPSTYRCPLCGNLLPALSEHMLLVPEGDAGRRRHAHTGCVLRARREGRLPTRDEWRRAQAAVEIASDRSGQTAADGQPDRWRWLRWVRRRASPR